MSSPCRFARRVSPFALVALLTAHTAFAQVSGTVRILATDQQNLPLPTAEVTIKAVASAWMQTALVNLEGEAVFPTVPVGQYVVTVTFDGFSPAERQIVVASNTVTPVAVQLQIAGLAETVEVAAVIQRVNPESSRTETVVGRSDIIRDPGADQNGSLAMITNNAPGAYMLHDHLHSRGGHGVSWEIDGVPVPSSAMAVVGSQFDPKDVDSLEINRGGLSTNLGDRPYGVFNVVPRSGFEASRFGDVTATYGSHQLGSVHVAFGDHSADQKLAYFASASANRTDRGLERVAIPVLHDAAHGIAGFASVVYNKSSHDQLRFIGASRSDRFEVPNTVGQQALGIDDREAGADSFANLTWLHTSNTGTVVTVSPYTTSTGSSISAVPRARWSRSTIGPPTIWAPLRPWRRSSASTLCGSGPTRSPNTTTRCSVSARRPDSFARRRNSKSCGRTWSPCLRRTAIASLLC